MYRPSHWKSAASGLIWTLCSPLGLITKGDDAPLQADHSAPATSSINEWRSFREDELRQLERRRADAKTFSKFSDDTLNSLAPLATRIRPSTVAFLDGKDRRLCYGIIVDPGGHVLTKASEVAAAGDTLQCRFIGGITVSAAVTDMFQPYDLALVKVNATGLRAVDWELGANEGPGTIVLATGLDEVPLSFGVLSVHARRMNPGFIGVSLVTSPNGAIVRGVLPQSAAVAAGIEPGDIISEVEGQPIPDAETLINTIKKFSIGDEVRIKINRSGTELETLVLLGSRFAAIPDANQEMLERMEVKLSANRIDYPSALEHDLPLDPSECGGPLVNLEGQVIGMNIARAGRIRSLAISSADIAPLLNTTAEGRFSIPDSEALIKQLAAAKQAVEHAQSTLTNAITTAANLERALENVKKYRLPRREEEEESPETNSSEAAIPQDGSNPNPNPDPGSSENEVPPPLP
ncbi:MAG: PDZ domain-containing protein [Verrucomicrobia bacterium]|nr:PDZ domain-containing protein [Verrucomicrobiota bacterium]